jgi:Fic family protein
MSKSFAVDIPSRTTPNAQTTHLTSSNNNKTPMPFFNQNANLSKSPGKNKKIQAKKSENEKLNNHKGENTSGKFGSTIKEPRRNQDNFRNPHFRKLLFYLKQSQLFKFFLLLLLTIFTNSLYFNFYYLPTRLEYSEHPAHKSNQPKPSLPYLGRFLHSKNTYLMRFESYDHVAFPSFDHRSTNELVDSQHASSAQSAKASNELKETFTERPLESILNKENLNEQEKRTESRMALSLAKKMIHEGKEDKAAKLYKYALDLDPKNGEALTSYGEFLELSKNDVVNAEHFYIKAVKHQPKNDQAHLNLKRTAPIVSKLDKQTLDSLDSLLKRFYEIPTSNSALKRAKRDAYFMHIYHSNAIEGNTLNLKQTRHILENRVAIGGKSLLEHQEVIGLDAAMRYLNETLLYRALGEFTLNDILEIHRRVLGFTDPIEAGKIRKHQVYVGDFVPPKPEYVRSLMYEFVDWLNSNQLLNEAHPIQIAALAHYKFVWIHPFYDGNGRTGRLLMNLILMKFGYPPVIIQKEDRLIYYEYLEMANQGDIKPFIRFIARCTERTLKEYIRLCTNTFDELDVDEESKKLRHDLQLVDARRDLGLYQDIEGYEAVNSKSADSDLNQNSFIVVEN